VESRGCADSHAQSNFNISLAQNSTDLYIAGKIIFPGISGDGYT